jgi:hypothetical protein
MFLILAGLLVWYPAILGWGVPLVRVLRHSESDPIDTLIYAALGGIAFLAAVVAALNFLTPIRDEVALALLAIGWGAFVFGHWRWRLWPLPSKPQLLFAAILLISLSWIATQPPYNYETGLYHLQSVKWLTSSTVPYGLANVLGQFGFNSALFSFAAALEVPWLRGESVFLANTLIVFVFGLAVGGAASQFSSLRRVSLASTFLVMGILPFVEAVMGPNLVSFSADLPITLIMLLAAYLFIKALRAPDLAWQTIAGLTFIAFFAITLKLSAAPLALYPLALLGLVIQKDRVAFRTMIGRLGLFGVTNGLVLFTPWVARNVALTGCLVFPILGTCFSGLPWHVPASEVTRSSIYVQNWARGLQEDLPAVTQDLSWISRLFNPTSVGIIVLLMALALGLYWLGTRRNKQASAYPARYLLPIGILLAGVGFWFFTAPDVRFGEGYFWGLGFYMFSLGLYRFYTAYELKGIETLVTGAGVVVMVIVGLVWPFFVKSAWEAEAYWISNTVELRQPRTRLLWQWPAVPKLYVIYHVVEPNNGFIYTPYTSFPCWDAPLPCVPDYPDYATIKMPHNDLSEVSFSAKP